MPGAADVGAPARPARAVPTGLLRHGCHVDRSGHPVTGELLQPARSVQVYMRVDQARQEHAAAAVNDLRSSRVGANGGAVSTTTAPGTSRAPSNSAHVGDGDTLRTRWACATPFPFCRSRRPGRCLPDPRPARRCAGRAGPAGTHPATGNRRALRTSVSGICRAARLCGERGAPPAPSGRPRRVNPGPSRSYSDVPSGSQACGSRAPGSADGSVAAQVPPSGGSAGTAGWMTGEPA